MEEKGNIFINLPQAANMTLPDPGLVQLYRDYESRVIWLDDEVCEDTRDIAKFILQCNREDKGLEADSRKPIKLLIASPGGSCDVADAIISVINLSKTPIYGVAMECVASAASMIYLACNKKYALPNAYFVLHQGSLQGLSGDYSTVKAAMDDYQEQVEKLTKYYIDNTGYTEEEVRQNIQKDWYIHTDEALKFRVVDEIVTDIDVLV